MNMFKNRDVVTVIEFKGDAMITHYYRNKRSEEIAHIIRQFKKDAILVEKLNSRNYIVWTE